MMSTAALVRCSALEVDALNALELLVGHLGKASVLDDARVVDQVSMPAHAKHHVLDHERDAFLVGRRLETERFATDTADRGQRFRHAVILMSQTATLAPSFANLIEVALPMPCPPPVMMETLP